MKKLSLFIIALVAFSCSKNDNYTPPVNNSPTVDPKDLIVTTFLPTTNAIWWKYNTTNTMVIPAPAAGTSPTTNSDQLNVDSDVTVANIPYKLMKTTAAPTGFYSTMLNDNKLRVDGSSVKLTGDVSFNLGTNPISLNVTDLTIFKENAVAGATLSTPQSGSKLITPLGASYSFDIKYIIKAVSNGDLASLVVGAQTYTNLKVVKIYVNIDATANLPGGIGAKPALDPQTQDVIVSTQYWVKDLGVVFAETNVSYKLDVQIAAFAAQPIQNSRNVKDSLDSKSF